MARFLVEDKMEDVPEGELPDWMISLAMVLHSLRIAGFFEEVCQRLEVMRKVGGHQAEGLVAFLIAYFEAMANEGLRPFYGRASGYWPQLSALAGLTLMPSPAALSRMLSSLKLPAVRSFVRWLLVEGLDSTDLLNHPAVQHRDAQGVTWHVFDFDPTGTAFRQRALPDREELSKAKRLATQRGRPGRCGRKRGEVVSMRSVLQHAGSALIFDLRVESGIGAPREQFSSAVEAITKVCERIAHPREHALIRSDGQFGGVPYIAIARQHGVRFLSRCARYNLLELDEVRAALQGAHWVLVPDSGSGPQRSATDVGWVLLDSQATDENKKRFEPQRVRIVAARSPAESDNPARGTVIDDVCYELFVTDLDEAGWPAHEVVAAYYGRCGQECRFAQEARELALDRTYSYRSEGQELVSALGAFVWNRRILAGFLADPPPVEDVPSPVDAKLIRDERELATLPAPEAGTEVSTRAEPDEATDEPAIDEDTESAHRHLTGPELRARRAARNKLLRKHLPAAFVGTRLEDVGWKADKAQVKLTCPRGKDFRWKTFSRSKHGYRLVFKGSKEVCAGCALKEACRGSAGKKRSSDDYLPSLKLSTALGERIFGDQPVQHRRRKAKPPPKVIQGTQADARWAVRPPSFLPAMARRYARKLNDNVKLRVLAPPIPPRAKPHEMIAPSPRKRAHGRSLQAERLDRYRLPPDATVRVTTIRRSRAA